MGESKKTKEKLGFYTSPKLIKETNYYFVMDKPKWNSKIHSSNPQEGEKRKQKLKN